MTVKDIQEDRAEGRIALASGTVGESDAEFSDDMEVAEGVSAKMQKHKTFDIPAMATVGMPRGHEFAMALVHTSPEFLDFCATLFLGVQSRFLEKPIQEGSLTIHLSESENFSVWLLPVRELVVRKIFPDVSAYYTEENRPCPPHWQVVLADSDGRFPWEAECAAEIVFGQPIFGDLDEEKTEMLKKSAARAYESLVEMVQENAPACATS
jgi:hypothetical protein